MLLVLQIRFRFPKDRPLVRHALRILFQMLGLHFVLVMRVTPSPEAHVNFALEVHSKAQLEMVDVHLVRVAGYLGQGRRVVRHALVEHMHLQTLAYPAHKASINR